MYIYTHTHTHTHTTEARAMRAQNTVRSGEEGGSDLDKSTDGPYEMRAIHLISLQKRKSSNARCDGSEYLFDLVKAHMERRSSILGPNQSGISPSILWYTKIKIGDLAAAPEVDGSGAVHRGHPLVPARRVGISDFCRYLIQVIGSWQRPS